MKKRHRMLVYTGFQMKYIISVIAIAVVTLGVLGYLYASVLSDQRQLLGLNQVTSGMVRPAEKEATFEKEMRAQFGLQDRTRVVSLVVISAVLVLLLALVSLRITHRIAGPVYVVSNALKALAMGKMEPVRPLRKRDEFAFLTDDLQALRESLMKKDDRMKEMADNIVEVLDSIELSRDEDGIVVDELKTEINAFVQETQAGRKDG